MLWMMFMFLAVFLYDVILRCPETPEVFALYMSLAVPQYELLGVYRHMGAL